MESSVEYRVQSKIQTSVRIQSSPNFLGKIALEEWHSPLLLLYIVYSVGHAIN